MFPQEILASCYASDPYTEHNPLLGEREPEPSENVLRTDVVDVAGIQKLFLLAFLRLFSHLM
jgi:hypothetical protein